MTRYELTFIAIAMIAYSCIAMPGPPPPESVQWLFHFAHHFLAKRYTKLFVCVMSRKRLRPVPKTCSDQPSLCLTPCFERYHTRSLRRLPLRDFYNRPLTEAPHPDGDGAMPTESIQFLHLHIQQHNTINQAVVQWLPDFTTCLTRFPYGVCERNVWVLA